MRHLSNAEMANRLMQSIQRIIWENGTSTSRKGVGRNVVFSWSVCYVKAITGQLPSSTHDFVILDFHFVLLIKHIRHRFLISLETEMLFS